MDMKDYYEFTMNGIQREVITAAKDDLQSLSVSV